MPLRSIHAAVGPLLGGVARRVSLGIDLLYPPSCSLCGQLVTDAVDAVALCDGCRSKLPDAAIACLRCGQPLPATNGTQLACPACARRPPRFDAVVRLGRYEGGLREAVLRMKHRNEEPLMLALGRLLASHRWAEIEALRPSCVIPVPMHWTRRLWRGVNSPEVVARVLAKRLSVPMKSSLLRRVRRTQPQASLTPWQRRPQRPPRLPRKRSSKQLTGARILLIDDIMTTGATANEATATLRRCGADFVAVAVLARAVE